MRLKNDYKNLDYGLIITVLMLFTIGMISIFTATHAEGLANNDTEIYIIKQIISFIIGCVMVFFLIKSDYNFFADHWKWIYLFSILVLLVVFIPGVGTTNMGTTGRGLFNQGTMTKLDFLPAQWTDFIYSVISETTGFIGATLVILLFLFFMLRLLRSAKAARDMYGTLVIFGVFFMFLFQITENIGMTIGLLPITGITLPFMSYGGSSLIINMIAVGFVLNIYRRRLNVQF